MPSSFARDKDSFVAMLDKALGGQARIVSADVSVGGWVLRIEPRYEEPFDQCINTPGYDGDARYSELAAKLVARVILVRIVQQMCFARIRLINALDAALDMVPEDRRDRLWADVSSVLDEADPHGVREHCRDHSSERSDAP